MWDSTRKCIDIAEWFRNEYQISGWRKSKLWRREIKHIFRTTSKVSRSGGKNKEERLKGITNCYLQWCKKLDKKITCLSENIQQQTTPEIIGRVIALSYYHKMLKKHIDLVDRRIIKGEVINSDEKLYSIFETHTEWIRKGKSHKYVELGHNMLIATDQYHFIIHHRVIEKQPDSFLTVELGKILTDKFPGQIQSLSLDKGFYSMFNKVSLQGIIPMVVMQKKGKRNKKETEEEHSPEFIKLRYAHSAVESNINQLEHNGLNRCPDKGIKNFKRYASLSVLAYNIHRLGKYTTELSLSQDARKAA